MRRAVVKMCDDFGVPEENIRFDDFGGQSKGQTS